MSKDEAFFLNISSSPPATSCDKLAIHANNVIRKRRTERTQSLIKYKNIKAHRHTRVHHNCSLRSSQLSQYQETTLSILFLFWGYLANLTHSAYSWLSLFVTFTLLTCCSFSDVGRRERQREHTAGGDNLASSYRQSAGDWGGNKTCRPEPSTIRYGECPTSGGVPGSKKFLVSDRRVPITF
jgi:hypothetical protein